MIKLIAKIMLFVMLLEMAVPVLKETGPAEAYAATWLCGQDLNGDGYTDAEGETAHCIVAAQGQLCPIGAVNCTDKISTAMCPDGSTLNGTSDKCEANPTISCQPGYAYDQSLDLCVQAASCPSNGVLNTNADLCEILLNDGSCPVGYTYDNILQACVQNITCSDGGTYNAVRDRCEIAATLTCPAGYAFNAGSGKCEQAPPCPSGSTYSTTVDKCIQNATIGCPSGYSYNSGTGKCEQSPSCPSGGSYSYANNRCEVAATYNYVPQYQCSFNGAVYSDPTTCSNNCYNWAYCNANPYYNTVSFSGGFWANIPSLQGWSWGLLANNSTYGGGTLYSSGVSFSGYVSGDGYCPIAAIVGQGSYLEVYVLAFAGCDGDGCYCSAPSLKGYIYISGANAYGTITGNGAALYGISTNGSNTIYGYGSGTSGSITFYGNQLNYSYSCPLGGYGCGGSPPYCVAYYGCNNISYGYYTCPSGYSLSGSTCLANPTCGSGGSLNGTTDKCELNPSFTCPGGFTYDSGTGKCVAAVTCPSSGVLNTAADKCQLSQIANCPGSYAYDASNSICQSAVVCAPGTFDAALDKCKVVASNLCPSGYTFNQTSGKCERSPVCLSGATYSNAADTCTISADHQCPTNMTYAPSSRLCEAIPICTGSPYDPVNDGCNEGAVVCPLGNFACVTNGQGVNQCSPNPCIDTDTTQAEITKVNDTMLQDDGPRDADGNCLGQIYLFTGRGLRCRPNGMTVGYVNNCCKNNQSAVSDSVGSLSQLQTAVSAVKTIYEIGQAAYYANAIAQGTAFVKGAGLSSVTIVSTTGTTTVTGAAGAALSAGTTSGAIAAGSQTAVSTAVSNCATAMINPVTIAVAVVIAVAMKVLMGGGCDQQDLESALLRDSGMCHYVGDYCEKKWPLIGCVQKAKGYCCFNSKLGRIIHEQGRPQLKVFQPNGAWGQGASPNCRGFTPEEFQMLDFGQIDLSEYFTEIQTKAVETIQQNATDKIQQYYQNIR